MSYNKLNYGELYTWGRRQLEEADVPDAGTDARLLLEWCCKTDRNTLLVHRDRGTSEEEGERYRKAIDQRKSRIPLQYITGEQEFMGLTYEVNEYVLVPRQDTEILVEEVLRNLHDGMRILDLCTGSGCILLSLLRYSNGCTGIGTDLSAEALKVAERNACRIIQRGMDDEPSVMFKQSDLFQELDQREKFDIIVSNPPI